MRHYDIGHGPAAFDAVVADLLPLIRPIARGAYAVSVGGSIGKGTADERSDIDFRLFCEATIDEPARTAAIEALDAAIARWADRGTIIDGCWIRLIPDVDAALEAWVSGSARPSPLVWTVWGYYLPTDIFNQFVIEDPQGVLASWKAKLTPYPSTLKQSIIDRHSASLRYWTSDYHYRNKVERGDAVFLAGLSSRLVHDIVQILYAVNGKYYPGDGKNIEMLADSTIVPPDFNRRVTEALYPAGGTSSLESQRESLSSLAEEVLAIAASDYRGTP